jgi:predicted acyltransferase
MEEDGIKFSINNHLLVVIFLLDVMCFTVFFNKFVIRKKFFLIGVLLVSYWFIMQLFAHSARSDGKRN